MGKHDSWWNRRIAGVPQHQGYIDDPDNIPETVLQQDPYGGKYLKDSVKRPDHYVDQATYYTPKYRPEVDEAARIAAHNAALAQQAQAQGFKFNEGGQVPMMGDKDVKKITQKDRYGNQISYEFEAPVKPLDQTAIVKEMLKEGGEGSMSMEVPPMMDHPGEPRGTDTVPAWLTPGEFVVNAEATEMFGPQIEAMNDKGRAVQAQKGMQIPNMPAGYQEGGMIPAPFIAGPRLNDPMYAQKGSWVTESLLDKLAEVESGGDNEAVSPVGAIGKYQWLPKSAKQAGYGIKAFDPKDEKSARAATKQYLENMAKYHDFTPEEALRAYNWGPGNVLKYKKGKRKDIPSEALNYPGKILGIENTQGVTPPPGTEPPMPQPRPGQEIPTPTPRPGEENWWDKLTGSLGFEGGGMVPKYYQDGDLVPTVPGFEGQDPYKMSPIRKAAYDKALATQQNQGVPVATPETINRNNPEVPVVPGLPSGDINTIDTEDDFDLGSWAAKNILGPTAKDKLGVELEEEDKAFIDKQTATSEKLAGPQIAEEENLIADLAEEPAVDTALPTPRPEKVDPNVVRNQLVADLDQSSEIDQDEEAGMDKDIGNIQAKGAEEVAKDPTITEQASNLIQDTFGSLFDPKELARMAVMYAGGRALGYSHQGSLRSAAKGYIQRIDAKQAAKVSAAGTREKRAFELAKTDRFTPASVSAYRASGNPADLVSKKSTAGVTSTGVTEQRIGPGGKKVSVQQVKTADGSTGYQLPNGQIVNKAQLENATKKYDPSFDKGTSEYRTRRARSVKSSESLFKEIQGREDAYKKDDETKYSTDILPQQAAQDFWTFAESYGIDPESDEAQDLMGAAYRQAIAQASIEGAPRAKNLKNFLEASYIRQQTGAPELFQVNPDKDAKEQAKYVRSDKMTAFTSRLDNVADFIPTLQNATKTDKRNQMTAALVTKWGSLTEKEKAQWNRKANEGQETGFYLFSMNEANEWITNKKLGE